MKKRIRTQPSNPFYSDEPAVAKSKIADRPPVQNSSLGSKSPKGVDKHPGRMSGFDGFVSKAKPAAKNSVKVPSFGSKAKSPAQLRGSNNPKAHRLGMSSLKKI